MLLIPNPDELSMVRYKDIAPKQKKYYFYNADNELLLEDTLRMEQFACWLSVNPLAKKYPSHSPYNFVVNSPLMFIDPDGRAVDDYGLDNDGYVTCLRKTDDSFDKLIALDMQGNETENFIIVNDRGLLPALENNEGAVKYDNERRHIHLMGTYANTEDVKDAFSVFKFGSDYSDTEWALLGSRNGQFTLGNTHEPSRIASLIGYSLFDLEDLKFDYHSHPGAESLHGDRASKRGDMSTATNDFIKLKQSIPNINRSHLPKYYIYRPHVKKPYRFEYDAWNNRLDPVKVSSWKNL